MSENGIECPKCHYAWYKYYTKIDNQEDEEVPLYNFKEVPVVVISPRGYLCRFCRYEWKEDGTPVEQETIEQHTTSFRKHGKALREERKSVPRQDKPSKTRDRNEGFIPR